MQLSYSFEIIKCNLLKGLLLNLAFFVFFKDSFLCKLFNASFESLSGWFTFV